MCTRRLEAGRGNVRRRPGCGWASRTPLARGPLQPGPERSRAHWAPSRTQPAVPGGSGFSARTYWWSLLNIRSSDQLCLRVPAAVLGFYPWRRWVTGWKEGSWGSCGIEFSRPLSQNHPSNTHLQERWSSCPSRQVLVNTVAL